MHKRARAQHQYDVNQSNRMFDVEEKYPRIDHDIAVYVAHYWALADLDPADVKLVDPFADKAVMLRVMKEYPL